MRKEKINYMVCSDSLDKVAGSSPVRCAAAAPVVEEELRRMNDECAQLKRQVQKEREERLSLAKRYFELQKRYTTLTRVQVAAERLLTPQPRVDVYAAILEVVANLVGSEEVGVFLFDQQECFLRLVTSWGIDSARFSAVPLGSSLIGRCAAIGELFVANEGCGDKPGHEDGLTACIPLRRDGLLLGAIAIFGLLGQRVGFDEGDVELFEAIAKWASLAVYCTASGWVTVGKEPL